MIIRGPVDVPIHSQVIVCLNASYAPHKFRHLMECFSKVT